MATQQLPRFAALQARMAGAVTRHLTNALLTVGGSTWAAMYDAELPDAASFLDVATVTRHSIRLHGAGLDAQLFEGATCTVTHAGWPDGRACLISTPVDLDGAGFVFFDIVPV